jgi:hypothetical protein
MTKHICVFVCVGALAAAVLTAGQGHRLKPIKYTADGVTVPDYSKWVFIGSGLGMSYREQAEANPPFTNVFAEPAAYDEYMKNGVWPDRTVLIAERRSSITNLSINKYGFAQVGPTLGPPEIEIKDQSKGGWVFYDVPKGETIAKPLPKSMACDSCHAEHAAVDNTFVQFYPTLIDVAKHEGTFHEGSR